MNISTGEIHLDMIEGSNDAILIKPFDVFVNNKKYRMPKGMRWDGASLPRLLYPRFGTPLDKLHRKASCFHDAAYGGLFPKLTRAQADKIYRALLVDAGQSKWLAFWEWLGVRIFGWIFWGSAD